MKKNIAHPHIWQSLLVGLFSGLFLFFVFGAVSAVYDNSFFTRMTPVGFIEWFFLVSTSFLLGLYFGLHHFIKKNNLKKSNVCATGGGVLGFLTFGCSVCNKILVLILGVTGIVTYFEPIRPWFGLLSLVFLSYANYVLIMVIITKQNSVK